jgi:hypothetical protein
MPPRRAKSCGFIASTSMAALKNQAVGGFDLQRGILDGTS